MSYKEHAHLFIDDSGTGYGLSRCEVVQTEQCTTAIRTNLHHAYHFSTLDELINMIRSALEQSALEREEYRKKHG